MKSREIEYKHVSRPVCEDLEVWIWTIVDTRAITVAGKVDWAYVKSYRIMDDRWIYVYIKDKFPTDPSITVEVLLFGDVHTIVGEVRNFNVDNIEGFRIIEKENMSENKEMVVRPEHYYKFGISVDKICQFVLNQPENDNLDRWEASKMCDELEYRLRAGFKTGEFEEDMQKAMNIHKRRCDYGEKRDN